MLDGPASGSGLAIAGLEGPEAGSNSDKKRNVDIYYNNNSMSMKDKTSTEDIP